MAPYLEPKKLEPKADEVAFWERAADDRGYWSEIDKAIDGELRAARDSSARLTELIGSIEAWKNENRRDLESFLSLRERVARGAQLSVDVLDTSLVNARGLKRSLIDHLTVR